MLSGLAYMMHKEQIGCSYPRLPGWPRAPVLADSKQPNAEAQFCYSLPKGQQPRTMQFRYVAKLAQDEGCVDAALN